MPKLIVIEEQELYDAVKNEFINLKRTEFKIEHSLVSVAKWESKWHVPFLDDSEKTEEMLKDYIRCMTISQNVDPRIYDHLTVEAIQEINEYIDDPMTATVIKNNNRKRNDGSFITSEIIYYWMIAQNIPVEFEKWHLNRLLTLIQVCSEKNANADKKMNKKDIVNQNKLLNAARKSKYKTKG